MDVSKFIQAKSDQLNADDLMGGPANVRIMGVKQGSAEQPVIIEIDGGYQPYKPSKTERRVLVACWGADASIWIGRRIILWREPDVCYAGIKVGGIQILRLSHIEKEITLMLTSKRGKKSPRVIKPMPNERQEKDTTPKAEKKSPAPMSDEEFLQKLETSKSSIASGKVTAEQVIAKIEAAVLLTEAQREELETLKPQAAQAADPQSVQDNPTDSPDDMFDN